MFSKGSVTFPVGSIIVLEKLASPQKPINSAPSQPTPLPPAKEPFPIKVHLITIDDFGPPQALVVMVKREKGFNPTANNWEFLTVSGDAKKIEKREKEGTCQQCHAAQAKNDFVFRTYGP